MPSRHLRRRGLSPWSYQHVAPKSGNSLFAKLPPEIRCKIWRLLLVKPSGAVIPVHVPRDTAVETFFSMEMCPNVTFALESIMQTCRLFYQDQKDYLVFYKFNTFQFPRSRDCLTYVAATTPSRREAIRNITITLDPMPYKPSVVKKQTPGDRLRAIATLCPNLRVLRHEKCFYRAGTLTDWAVMLSEILTPIVATLPLLKEIYIRGSNGEHKQVECHMTLQNVEFTWKTETGQYPNYWTTHSTKFSKRGEKELTAVWEILSKRRTVYQRPLEPRRVKDAIATTPILTLGQHRQHQGGALGMPQNTRPFARAHVPDWIFTGTGTVKNICFPRNQIFPELLIGYTWYSWDTIFCSNRLPEVNSILYARSVLLCFKRKYVSWVYFSGTSKGRRHGNRSPQSKLINCIWQLSWQDRAEKLKILKDLYLHRDNRRRRRR